MLVLKSVTNYLEPDSDFLERDPELASEAFLRALLIADWAWEDSEDRIEAIFSMTDLDGTAPAEASWLLSRAACSLLMPRAALAALLASFCSRHSLWWWYQVKIQRLLPPRLLATQTFALLKATLSVDAIPKTITIVFSLEVAGSSIQWVVQLDKSLTKLHNDVWLLQPRLRQQQPQQLELFSTPWKHLK